MKQFVYLVLLCSWGSAATAQEMKIPTLSKKEVKELIQSGRAALDKERTQDEWSQIYVIDDGRLFVTSPDGYGGLARGTLYASVAEFDSIMAIDNSTELSVLNGEGWLNANTNMDVLLSAAIKTLEARAGKALDYSPASLKLVDKIKIKDLVAEREVYYALMLYACGYYAHHHGGNLVITDRSNEAAPPVYWPVIRAEKERLYYPYSSFNDAMADGQKCRLSQSIEVERYRYSFITN